MKISIYSDGANLDQIIKQKSPMIKGIASNPPPMKNQGLQIIFILELFV